MNTSNKSGWTLFAHSLLCTPESEVAEGKPGSSAGESGGADRAAEAGETESPDTGGTT